MSDIIVTEAPKCVHVNFAANVRVARLSGTPDGPVKNFMAEVTVKCADCGRAFQFLGLKAGLDLQGARTSLDGLEANIAICPQGEQPSTLDRIAVNFRPEITQ